MSLRNWVGLIVAAALLASPLLNLALLRLFPPPDLLFRTLPAPPPPEGPGPHPAEAGARLSISHAAGPDGPGLFGGAVGFGMPPRTQVRVFRGADGKPPPLPRLDAAEMAQHETAMQAIRQHFTLINLATIGILMLAAVLLLSLLLRRPVRRLLDSIGDIERGAEVSGPLRGPGEFRRIGLALQRMGSHLRASLRERELMLAGLSHDIRSPLARLQAAIELHATDHPGDFQPMLADIRDIDHIVHQCIDFVRDGRDEPLETLEFDALVRGALQRHEGLTLALGCPGLQFGGRRLGLQRLIRNLADNALHHGAAPVCVRTRHEGTELLLSVEDHGHGIDAREWPRLSEPFERGNRARDGRGAGLGLAIVQRVALAHGAELQLRERHYDRPFAVELRLPLPT
ncbi:MAG TPA: ATP-binding protein [Solimonas sp.]|nr:ATP-binding protein [Solimonas sp.]